MGHAPSCMIAWEETEFSVLIKRLQRGCNSSKGKDFYRQFHPGKTQKHTNVRLDEELLENLAKTMLDAGCIDQLMLRIFDGALRDEKNPQTQIDTYLQLEQYQEVVQQILYSNKESYGLEEADIKRFMIFYNLMTELGKAHLKTSATQDIDPVMGEYFDIWSRIDKGRLTRTLGEVFFSECERDSVDLFTVDIDTQAKMLMLMLSMPNLEVAHKFSSLKDPDQIFRFRRLGLPLKMFDRFSQALIISLKHEFEWCTADEVLIVREILNHFSGIAEFAFEHFALSQKLHNYRRTRKYSRDSSDSEMESSDEKDSCWLDLSLSPRAVLRKSHPHVFSDDEGSEEGDEEEGVDKSSAERALDYVEAAV